MADDETSGQGVEEMDEVSVAPAEGPAQTLPPPASTAEPAPPLEPGPLESASPPASFVYALGRVEPRFPSLSIEKEYAQVSARSENAGRTDHETLREVISAEENRYLARQLCWVFTVEGLETYILTPRDPGDFRLLIDTVRYEPQRDDLDVVIGVRGQVAPPELCNGLAVPVVMFDQLYSFDRKTLVDSIPRPASVPAKREAQFRTSAGEQFDNILQVADNAGATDEHRALNFVAVRYPAIYEKIAEAHEENRSFTGVEVLPSDLSGVRKIVEIVFSYTHRETDVTEKHFVRVDVTEEFPFLVTKLSPYFHR
jgi:PatG C-terminal